MKRLIGIFCCFSFSILASSQAVAIKCSPIGSVEHYKHIFIGRVVEGQTTEWAESTDEFIGIVRGLLRVEEVLKGNPQKVPYIFYSLRENAPLASDGGFPMMPLGYSIVIYARDDGPLKYGSCRSFELIRPSIRECQLYNIRHRLGLEQTLNQTCENELLTGLENRKRDSAADREYRRLERVRRKRIREIVEEAGFSYTDLSPKH